MYTNAKKSCKRITNTKQFSKQTKHIQCKKKKKNLHIQNAMYFQLKNNNNKARRNVWKMLIQK